MGTITVQTAKTNMCTPTVIIEGRKRQAEEKLRAAAAEAPKTSPSLDLSRLIGGTEIGQVAFNALDALDPKKADHLAFGKALNVFLDNLNFPELDRWVHLEAYGASTIYEHLADVPTLRNRLVEGQKAKKGEEATLTRRQALAFDFLVFNRSLSAKEIKEVFSDQPHLLKGLQGFGIIQSFKRAGQTHYRMNDLSLASHRLVNGEVIYAFIDLPKELGRVRREKDNAQLSETSYVLMEELERDYQQGTRRSGLAADFGSGTGIVAMALLKMNPGITKVYGVEIDERSMQLSRLNALVNGEAARFETIDNHNTHNLDRTLKNEKLDFAVSNPPFNADPSGEIAKIGTFGTGGTYGLDVTKIFIQQAMRNLKDGGEIKLYSVLASQDEFYHDADKNRFASSPSSLYAQQAVEKMVADKQIPFGVDLVFSPLPIATYWEDQNLMAGVMTYLNLNPGWRAHNSARFGFDDGYKIKWDEKKLAENKQVLEEKGIKSQGPFIWSVVKKTKQDNVKTRVESHTEVTSAVDKHDAISAGNMRRISKICSDEAKEKK